MTPRDTFACSFLLALVLVRTALGTPPGSSEAPVIITLRPAAPSISGIIRLRDVASLEGGQTDARDAMAKLDLAETQPGKVTHILQEQVHYRLLLAGFRTGSFKLQGQMHVSIRSDTKSNPEFKEQSLVAAAKEALHACLPIGAEGVTIKLNHSPRLPAIPAKADVHYVAEVQGARSGNVRVNVQVLVGERSHATVPVYFDVKYTLPVAVVRRRIGLGEIIAEDMVSRERILIAKGEDLVAANQAIGKKARATMLPGQKISAADVDNGSMELPVLVKSRDQVHLVAHIGTVRVTAVGEAEQDGRMGDTIRVRNSRSRKVVRGRVVDRNVVEVEY